MFMNSWHVYFLNLLKGRASVLLARFKIYINLKIYSGAKCSLRVININIWILHRSKGNFRVLNGQGPGPAKLALNKNNWTRLPPRGTGFTLVTRVSSFWALLCSRRYYSRGSSRYRMVEKISKSSHHIDGVKTFHIFDEDIFGQQL